MAKPPISDNPYGNDDTSWAGDPEMNFDRLTHGADTTNMHFGAVAESKRPPHASDDD